MLRDGLADPFDPLGRLRPGTESAMQAAAAVPHRRTLANCPPPGLRGPWRSEVLLAECGQSGLEYPGFAREKEDEIYPPQRVHQQVARGQSIENTAIEGAVRRLRPTMMTMLVAALGLLPGASTIARA